MSKITLITATGNRPEAFALCERWIAKQTLTPNQWLVVDDGSPATVCSAHQTLLRPPWRWVPGQVTLMANLLYAIPHVTGDLLLFIEDDDYYGSRYVELMAERLARSPLVGEIDAHYYHVRVRRYHINANRRHSSLCQVGLRTTATMMNQLVRACRGPSPWVDVRLFHSANGAVQLFPYSGQCIGMKGLPGRPGVGVGHQQHQSYLPDPRGEVLRQWMGQDAEAYFKFGGSE